MDKQSEKRSEEIEEAEEVEETKEMEIVGEAEVSCGRGRLDDRDPGT